MALTITNQNKIGCPYITFTEQVDDSKVEFFDLDPSTFYESLPTPGNANEDFLVSISLNPEQFQKWLRTLQFDTKECHDWLAILRMYMAHLIHTVTPTENAIETFEAYGLTKEAAKRTAARAGSLFEEMHPYGLVEGEVQSKLMEQLEKLEHT